MKNYAKIISIILLIVSPFLLTYSQSQMQGIGSFKPIQGLPSKIATSVFKDSKGFMWFGAENGLYRYDGYEFKAFRHDPGDSTSISGNMIWKILLEDDEGNMWISTVSNGLNIYNPNTDKFEHFTKNANNSFDFDFNWIHDAIQNSDGEAWMITRNNTGLVKFNKSTGECRIFRPNSDTIQSPANRVSAILEDSEGKMWIGTFGGIYIFNNDSETFTKLSSLVQIPDALNKLPIVELLEDKDKVFWIGTDAGLFKYNSEENHVEHFRYDENNPYSISNDNFISIFDNPVDQGNSLWIVTRIGFNKFDKSTGRVTRFNNNPNDPKSQVFNALFDMYPDDNGILWTGTGFAGAVIYNLKQNPFKVYDIGPLENEPFFYEATSFYKDNASNLWVGTGYGGLFKFDSQMNLINRYKPDPENPGSLSRKYVFSIYEDADDVLWVGTDVSLEVLNENANQFIPSIFSSNISQQYYRINDIMQDSHGYLWVGTNKGLYYQKKEGLFDTSFQQVPEFCANNLEIRKIAEDPSGAMWFGSTGEGLFQLKPENRKNMKFSNYRHIQNDNSSLSDDIVVSIYIDSEGILWVGTSNGLNRFDRSRNRFYGFNRENGLEASFIYYIEGDNRGNLWLSTENGIIRFKQTSDTTGHTKLLDRSDGVPFDDNYQYKIYKSKEGEIYVGGRRVSGNGFYCFHPDSLKDNEHIPPVVITELLVNNKLYKPDSNITSMKQVVFRYNQNFFSIKFAALDFVNPSKNKYAYKLEGFDAEWIYSERRLANYTNVPPGDYIFRAKGSNNDGLWNNDGVSLKITIAPPPWKTWWAYSIYTVIIFVLIYAWRVYDLKRIKLKQQLELEHIQTDKLEELDRIKSRFFANISHEFRTPLTLILGPLGKLKSQISGEAKKDLDMIQRNARRLQNLINQLLSLSKLESGKMKLHTREENIVPIVNGYVQLFESLAKQKNIDLNFKSTEDNIPLFIDKEKIEKILYNLLSNAFKFTMNGGKIEVELRVDNIASKWVTIEISDTGKGILPEKLENIFDRFYQADDSLTRDQEGTGIGLSLTKELVELHHGKILVESKIGKGTVFNVLLLLGKEHLKPEEIAVLEDHAIDPVESFKPIEQVAQHAALNNDETFVDVDYTDIEDSRPLLLVVEDNDDLRSYIRSYLIEDYRISEAIDGVMGLNKAIDKIPDLVISDVMMPKMNGYEFCQKLKADDRTSHIPVILLTAKAAVEDKLEGLETGADDFLTKPFDPDELLVRIRNLIHQRNLLRERFIREFSFPSQPVGKEELSMDQKFLSKAKKVVEENLSDPDFSVVQFGTAMALSRSQLHRKFRALLDQSPIDFIRIIRLNRASVLLANESANVAEIAYDVGFNNPSYFAECFRKQFGKLPSEYNN